MILQQPPMQTSEGPPTQQGSTTCWPALDSVYALGAGPVVPLVPCTGIFLGPSKSGKTVALISLILEQYRGVF